jgi:Mn-containing catalase
MHVLGCLAFEVAAWLRRFCASGDNPAVDRQTAEREGTFRTMFYSEAKLQFPVRVEKPNPVFGKALQQAIGGVEGEIRVCLQYLFQAWGSRGPAKYRDLLLTTGTEEMGHIEMLATAVALNLEDAPLSMQEDIANDPIGGAVLNGMDMRHILSTGLAAMPADANGVPFDCSHVYASGNAAADMYANVTAEATGRALAVRLYNMTDDPGMKDMLQFLIARDTMHQNQWLAAIEDMGDREAALPIPNSHPQSEENKDYSYVFLGFDANGTPPPKGRWTSGKSMDGKGEFRSRTMEPVGEEPQLAPAREGSGAQSEQMVNKKSRKQS